MQVALPHFRTEAGCVGSAHFERTGRLNSNVPKPRRALNVARLLLSSRDFLLCCKRNSVARAFGDVAWGWYLPWAT
eukprot:366351-Chlamydomonas_euryale.AAC.16